MSHLLESALDAERRQACAHNDACLDPPCIQEAINRTNATLRFVRQLIVTTIMMVMAFYAGVGFEHTHHHRIPAFKVDPSAIKLVDNARSAAHDNLLEQQNVRDV